MNDWGITKNASGYYDETAYKAITNLAKAGEVWTHKLTGESLLVLNSNGRVCNCLKLLNIEKGGDCIEVVCGADVKYTGPTMVMYVFGNLLAQYTKTVPADNFGDVQKAVKKALGLSGMAGKENVQADKAKALQAECEAVRHDLDELMIAHSALREEVAELRPYKRMYDELLDKLLAKVVIVGE